MVEVGAVGNSLKTTLHKCQLVQGWHKDTSGYFFIN